MGQGPGIQVKELRDYLRALGDVVRLQIVRLLVERGEMRVLEMSRELRLSQPLISWHLAVLRRAGVVRVRREGRHGFYALDLDRVRRYQAMLTAWLSIQFMEEEG